MSATQAPIKVDPQTKETIRVAAALLGRTQSDVVGAAVCEYVANHADEFRSGIDAAKQALALGPVAAASFETGDSLEAVTRVSGSET